MACSVVVTIPMLRRVCEDWLDRVAGAALADPVDRGNELLDRVSLIHLTPSQVFLDSVRLLDFIERR
jgi:hypothetical protein